MKTSCRLQELDSYCAIEGTDSHYLEELVTFFLYTHHSFSYSANFEYLLHPSH